MKMPAAWASAPTAQTKAQASTKVEARIDMSEEVAGAGLCPDCKQPMVPMVAASVETLTCMGCRISLPTQDPESVVQEDSRSTDEVNAVQGPSTAQNV